MNIKKGDLIRATREDLPNVVVEDKVVSIRDWGLTGSLFNLPLDLWDIEVIKRKVTEPVIGMKLRSVKKLKYIYVPRSDLDTRPWVALESGIRFAHEEDIWPRVNLPEDDFYHLVIVENPGEDA